MNKVVYNACYGGYGLSKAAAMFIYDRLTPEEKDDVSPDRNLAYYLEDSISRHDPRLVEAVEVLGEKANGSCAKLEVRSISSNVYKIDECDGYESVETPDELDWEVIG